MDGSVMFSYHKGLQNAKGENNCFLNAAIQTLWHLDSFRLLLQMSEENSFPSTSLFIQLKTMFAHFQFGDNTALPPDEVRAVLSSRYRDQQRFQRGEMEDAGETLEAILQLIHCEEVGAESREAGEDEECEPPCLSHSVFCCRLVDQYSCLACRSTSNPEPSSDFVYRVYVQDLLRQARKQDIQIGAALASLIMTSDERSCPDEGDNGERRCRGSSRLSRWCLNLPLVFSFNLVWPSARVSKKDVKAVLSTITYDLDLLDFLNVSTAGSNPEGEEESTLYHFRGMICYSKLHYFSYFFSTRRKRWLLFDDARVCEIGTWSDVVRRCEKGEVQPTTLLYERAEVTASFLKNILNKQEQARVLKHSLGGETILVEKHMADAPSGEESLLTNGRPHTPHIVPSSECKIMPNGNTTQHEEELQSATCNNNHLNLHKASKASEDRSASATQSTNPFDPSFKKSTNPFDELSSSWAVIDHNECKGASENTSQLPSDNLCDRPPLPATKDPSGITKPRAVSGNSNASDSLLVEGYCVVESKPEPSAPPMPPQTPMQKPKEVVDSPVLQELLQDDILMRKPKRVLNNLLPPQNRFAPPLPSASGPKYPTKPEITKPTSQQNRDLPMLRFPVVFSGDALLGGIGLELQEAEGGLVVTDFVKNKFGQSLVAERCGLIHLMDKVLQIDERLVEGMSVTHFKQEIKGRFSQPFVRLKFLSTAMRALNWKCHICQSFNILEDLSQSVSVNNGKQVCCKQCLAHCQEGNIIDEIKKYNIVYS